MGYLKKWRGSQPEKLLGVCLFTEVMSGLIRGDERVWPDIIQLPLHCDILEEAQLNRPLYDKKLVAPAPKNITIIPYVRGYFMKGSEFDVKRRLFFMWESPLKKSLRRTIECCCYVNYG